MASRASLRILLVVIVGIACLANSIDNPLLFDDFESIAENPQIRQLKSLDILMPERELPVAGRPLANVTLAINYAFSGVEPRGYRITNLAFHIACAIAVLLLLRELLRLDAIPGEVRRHADAISLVAALMWVAHPMNSEVVNYLTQRTESLMALFYLVALYGSFRALRSPSRGWIVFAAMCGMIGALSKETIVTLPLAVALLDRLLVFGSWRDAWRSRRGLYAALASCWIVIAALQATNPRPLSAGFSSGASPWLYLVNQAQVLTHYAKVTLWPSDLVALYGPVRPLALADVMPAAVFILLLIGLTAFACTRWPAIGAVGVWVFLTLAPTSSILPIATEVGAERRMYLPLVAIAALVAAVLWTLPRRAWISIVCSALIVGAASVTTYARNRDYADQLYLAEQVLQRWPTGMAHQFVAEGLLQAGRRAEAFDHLRVAIVDTPRSHWTLGMELYRDGTRDEALSELQTFVRLEPWHALVPRAEGLIARIYSGLGRAGLAADFARRALAKTPVEANAEAALGDVAFDQEQYDVAIAYYRRSLTNAPGDVDSITRLALALLSSGEVDEGIRMMKRLTELRPTSWQFRRNLALALLDASRPAESLIEAQQALALNPNDAASHTILGQALAGVGQREAALVALERALTLDPNDADARQGLAVLRQRQN